MCYKFTLCHMFMQVGYCYFCEREKVDFLSIPLHNVKMGKWYKRTDHPHHAGPPLDVTIPARHLAPHP